MSDKPGKEVRKFKVAKLSRDLRMILAGYVASKCGMSDTELDLAAIIKDPSPELSLSRFRGSQAERRRVEHALSLLEFSK
jgi:hypothetical protein